MILHSELELYRGNIMPLPLTLILLRFKEKIYIYEWSLLLEALLYLN